MQLKDPKPEILRLEELAIQVKLGEIKLPRFQRPFVWEQDDVINLLDSIYRGYPIGSLLIWNSSTPLKNERNIYDLKIDTEQSSGYPTNYLLDGQQRLTSLCGALFWDGTDESSIWNIHFDLVNEVFCHKKNIRKTEEAFPLNRLITTSDFIKQCMKFESSKDKEKLYKNAERLLRTIKDYKIAVVKVGDLTMEEVAPIFERINSAGRKLTMVDLMMAATYSNGFDLSSEIDTIKASAEQLGYPDLDGNIILRTISASSGLGINKEDIRRLREKKAEQLMDAVNQSQNSISDSLHFLSNHIGIKDLSFLPYGLQFTYLSEIFRLLGSESYRHLEHIKEWFWFTSATRYYGTSNTGQISQDLNTIRDYCNGNTPELFIKNSIDITKLLFDPFNLRNATSTTFALLLNIQNIDRTVFGNALGDSHLKLKNAKYYSGIFRNGSPSEKCNISRIIDPDGQHKLWDDALHNLYDIEKSFLNNEMLSLIKVGDDEGLINLRAKMIADEITKLTGCECYFNPRVQ